MATKNKEEIIQEDGYVDYYIHWERGNKTPCKNVIINGKKYSIPIGQHVKVPAVVAEVLDQSMEQQRHAEEVDRAMQKVQEIPF